MPHIRIILMIIPALCLAGLSLAHAEPCRALVNLRTPTGHTVLDVRFDDGAPQITGHQGLAAGSGTTVRQLRLLPGGDYRPTANVTWVQLQALDPVSKTTTTWMGKALVATPSGETDGDWWSSDRIGVGSILGPYITLSTGIYGYAGGAHDYDEADWGLHRVSDGKTVDPLALLEPNATLKSARAVTAQAKLDDPPTLALKDLRTAGLLFEGPQLKLSEIIDCCSWAENHNQFDLTAPVATPAALTPFVPDADGWITQGQCQVRHQKDTLDLGWHKGQTQKSFKHPGRLIGLSWIDAAAPKLAAFKVDHAGATTAMERARKWFGKAELSTIYALAERAFTLEPTAAWIAEAGWLAFRGKSLNRAEHLTRRALAVAPESDHPLGGMIRYNLGRIMEARRDMPAAEALYQASLKLRPHEAVRARLKSLQVILQESKLYGQISRSDFLKVIRAHRSVVRACYLPALDANPTLSGRLTLKFWISPSGRVSKVKVASSMGDHTVDRCIADRSRLWVFPPPRGNDGAVARTVFAFTPDRALPERKLTGRLSKAEISRVIYKHRAESRVCYETARNANYDLTGKIVVKFSIKPNGSVSHARAAKSTVGDPAVGQCIADRIKLWVFPPPRGNSGMVVRQAFSLKPSGAEPERTRTEKLSKSEISRVIYSHREEPRRCYETTRKAHHDLSDKIVMKFWIKPNGSVSEVRVVESTMDEPAVGQCVAERIRLWMFPKPRGNSGMVVRYPFWFIPPVAPQ